MICSLPNWYDKYENIPKSELPIKEIYCGLKGTFYAFKGWYGVMAKIS